MTISPESSASKHFNSLSSVSTAWHPEVLVASSSCARVGIASATTITSDNRLTNNFLIRFSLEAKIAKHKDQNYAALRKSQAGWHEGHNDPTPFIKYTLDIILAAYKDFEDRLSIIEEKRPALKMVQKATLMKIGRFTKQDIHELCPTLSKSSIEGALRKLIDLGEIKREGKGKNTYYYRLK